jgi:hypothetical protein
MVVYFLVRVSYICFVNKVQVKMSSLIWEITRSVGYIPPIHNRSIIFPTTLLLSDTTQIQEEA